MSSDYNKHEVAMAPLPSDSLILELPVPEEVISASATKPNHISKKEQQHYPSVLLFFSFDIVNSTMYKTMTGNWPLIIRSLLEDIQTRVHRIDTLFTSYLWRVIGDEVIFVLPIQSESSLTDAVEAIFEVTQRISISLKSGKFFDALKDQTLSQQEINILKSQNTLSIKATAWIAVVNSKLETPFDNIAIDYKATEHNRHSISEFLGQDIDTGFRLKGYTQDRRLCLSVELAYLLSNTSKQQHLHILDYVRLKGVWNESLYPIIWYYNAEVLKKCQLEMLDHGAATPFANSFRYDETDNNEIVKNYFLRGRSKRKNSKKNKKGDESPNSNNFELAESMYSADSALRKIIADKNLLPKIQYIQQHLHDEQLIIQSAPYAYPLGLHCAVVCCDVINRKILIAHRGQDHDTNPGCWEFGCAKASGQDTLVHSIKEHYQKAFGADIELVMNSSRQELQPLPIAVYELQKAADNILKGMIFVAKVINTVDPAHFRAESEHDRIAWISEDEMNNYKPENAVKDFHNTLQSVFTNFDYYFAQGD